METIGEGSWIPAGRPARESREQQVTVDSIGKMRESGWALVQLLERRGDQASTLMRKIEAEEEASDVQADQARTPVRKFADDEKASDVHASSHGVVGTLVAKA
jgi:hypothetical protein